MLINDPNQPFPGKKERLEKPHSTKSSFEPVPFPHKEIVTTLARGEKPENVGRWELRVGNRPLSTSLVREGGRHKTLVVVTFEEELMGKRQHRSEINTGQFAYPTLTTSKRSWGDPLLLGNAKYSTSVRRCSWIQEYAFKISYERKQWNKSLELEPFWRISCFSKKRVKTQLFGECNYLNRLHFVCVEKKYWCWFFA